MTCLASERSVQQKTGTLRHPSFDLTCGTGKLISGVGRSGGRSVGIAPADLIALGSGPEFALLALGRSFERAAAAHFFEDAFGIKLGFEALESTIDRLAFFYNYSTHASSWLVIG